MSSVSKLGRGLGCLGLDSDLVDWSSRYHQRILCLASWRRDVPMADAINGKGPAAM